jgi:TIR domain
MSQRPGAGRPSEWKVNEMVNQVIELAGGSDRLQIFLCHSSGDKNSVRDLYSKLILEGFDPWLDEKKLLPGQDWRYEISKALRKSGAVIVCLSRSSVSKEGFLQREIKDALDVADEKSEGTIFIIPARIEDCEIPDRLRRWQWVNLFEASGYEGLVRALHSRARALGITEPSDAVKLSDNEELALGLILADPTAGDRGAWLYPLHQGLTYRGCSQAEATLALNGLNAKGLSQFVEVLSWDSISKEERKAPACRITKAGIEYANRIEKIRGFNEKYRYRLVLQGSRTINQPLLEYLCGLPYMEKQTRFVDEPDPERSQIAIFSYQPLSEELVRDEAKRLSLNLVSLHKD